MATSLDLTIRQGNTFEQPIVVKDAQSVVIDLTGFEGRCQIRASASAATVIATIDVLILDAVTGSGMLYMSPQDTEDLMSGAIGVHDIKFFTPDDGIVLTPFAGNVTVEAEVTKP